MVALAKHFVLVLLVVLALARPSAAQTLALQPRALPCKDPIEFDLSGSIPKDPKIEASVEPSVDPTIHLDSELTGHLLKLHIHPESDCDKKLSIKVEKSSFEFKIEPHAAPIAVSRAPISTSSSKEENSEGAGTSSDHNPTPILLSVLTSATLIFVGVLAWMIYRLPKELTEMPVQRRGRRASDSYGGDPQELSHALTRFADESNRLRISIDKQLDGQLEVIKEELGRQFGSIAARLGGQQELPREKFVNSASAPSSQTAVAATLVQPPPPPKQPDSPKLSFVQNYNQMVVSSGAAPQIPGVSRQIVVNFRNPDAVDKNPNADEPLVMDNSGFLMIFFVNESLPDDQAYLAPSLEFRGKWTNTHSRKWRSLFEFSTNDASQLEKAAIVQRRGDEYSIVQKGRFV